MALLERGDGGEVHAGVVADGGVRAAAGLDADDAVRGEGFVADEKLGVLAGIDVIGNHRHGQGIAQPLAEPQDQHRLSGADGAADAETQRAHEMKSLSYAVSWRMLAISRSGLKQPRVPRSTPRESRTTARARIEACGEDALAGLLADAQELERGDAITGEGLVKVSRQGGFERDAGVLRAGNGEMMAGHRSRGDALRECGEKGRGGGLYKDVEAARAEADAGGAKLGREFPGVDFVIESDQRL